MSARILIVEDDPLIAMDLEFSLAELGFDVRATCASIAEATPYAQNGIDAAVLDVDVVDGKTWPLATVLRDRGKTVVFVSGAVHRDVPAHLRDAPFITKPFNPAEIARRLKRAPA